MACIHNRWLLDEKASESCQAKRDMNESRAYYIIGRATAAAAAAGERKNN